MLTSLACSARSADSPLPPPVSGDGSTFRSTSGAIRYMMTGEFDGRITWEGNRLVVTVNRGTITNTFPTDPPRSPLFAGVTIQVLIAQTSGRTWQRIAESVPVQVATGMDADTTLSVGAHRFEVPGVRPIAAGRSWVVIHMAASPLPGTPAYRDPSRRTSTYACSAEFLNGATRRGVSASAEHPLEC